MDAVLNGPGGRVIIESGGISIGRAQDNGLVLADPKSSSHHAEIRSMAQEYTITDFGSTNGTFVNEQRVGPNSPRVLHSGDRIRFGNTSFTFEADMGEVLTIAVDRNQVPYNPTVVAGPSRVPSATHYNDFPENQNPPPPPPGYAPSAPPPNYGQPGLMNNGLPNYQPAPPAPRPRNRNVLLWILGTIVVAFLACCVIFAVISQQPSPTRTLQTFCNSLKNKDYHTIYQQLSKDSAYRRLFTETQFVYAAGKSDSTSPTSTIDSCSVVSTSENGDTAQGVVNAVDIQGQSTNTPVQLVKEDGNWRISVIGPGKSTGQGT